MSNKHTCGECPHFRPCKEPGHEYDLAILSMAEECPARTREREIEGLLGEAGKQWKEWLEIFHEYIPVPRTEAKELLTKITKTLEGE